MYSQGCDWELPFRMHLSSDVSVKAEESFLFLSLCLVLQPSSCPGLYVHLRLEFLFPS